MGSPPLDEPPPDEGAALVPDGAVSGTGDAGPLVRQRGAAFARLAAGVTSRASAPATEGAGRSTGASSPCLPSAGRLSSGCCHAMRGATPRRGANPEEGSSGAGSSPPRIGDAVGSSTSALHPGEPGLDDEPREAACLAHRRYGHDR